MIKKPAVVTRCIQAKFYCSWQWSKHPTNYWPRSKSEYAVKFKMTSWMIFHSAFSFASEVTLRALRKNPERKNLERKNLERKNPECKNLET